MPSRRISADLKAAFMCECGASLCDARVSLSAADYDSADGPVLAQGHSPDCDMGKCVCCGRPYRSKRRKRR
jgi:hypothetical protein